MKRPVFILLTVLLLILLLSALAVASQAAHSGPAWEYLVARPVAYTGDSLRPQIQTGVVMNDEGVSFDGPLYIWLDALGTDGWELIEFTGGSFYFKRPK